VGNMLTKAQVLIWIESKLERRLQALILRRQNVQPLSTVSWDPKTAHHGHSACKYSLCHLELVPTLHPAPSLRSRRHVQGRRVTGKHRAGTGVVCTSLG